MICAISANDVARRTAPRPDRFRRQPVEADYAFIASSAHRALILEVMTWPKPGLVSHIDAGSHADMTAATFYASANSLLAYFQAITAAGARVAPMDELRRLGVAAEADMLDATGGVNTHRGAIFGLGMLCAAAGLRRSSGEHRPLGQIVASHWGRAILCSPLPAGTHGAAAACRYGAGGARHEAALGFPSLYDIALPALHWARAIRAHDAQAQRVQVLFALVSEVDDTNLLHRGGLAGMRWARTRARQFLAQGGIADNAWRRRAADIHGEFVARRLSPGGCADLLAMCLFVDAIDRSNKLDADVDAASD